MKAVVCERYGAPHVLSVEYVERPVPGKKDILVEVCASTVNSADVRVRALRVGGRIMTFISRLVLGWNGPRNNILGTSLSGVVVAVGESVSDFQIGDEIMAMTGIKMGAYAQYIVLPQKGAIGKKPHNASFEEAASLPFGATAALYFLEKAGLKQAKKILVYGATGAVGTSAVQIAALHGAEVTAVCSSSGTELVKKLGATEVVDYQKNDFLDTSTKYDIVFDAVGFTDKKSCSGILMKDGVFVTVEGMDIAHERREDLQLIAQWHEAGKFQAVIDKVYSLEQIVDAHTYVDTGRKQGNVVLAINQE